ncbi:hypothetical protein D7X87_26625, partial [bacterium D16-54]
KRKKTAGERGILHGMISLQEMPAPGGPGSDGTICKKTRQKDSIILSVCLSLIISRCAMPCQPPSAENSYF